MAGIWRIPCGERGLILIEPLICSRCGGPTERGFQWDCDKIVLCEVCVVPICAAMIFDTILERHEHVTRDLVEELERAIEARLVRISRNLDGGRIE
jgi:hypothetical protein